MSSLDHLVSILDCFSLEKTELGVREVARLVNLPPSTTGRMMTAMKEVGLLCQDPKSHAYSLGSKVLAWGGVYSGGLDVRRIALSYMEQLYSQTNETISLYVLEGDERVCVERMESKQSVRIVARVGRRLPLYAGSAGKAFLAFIDETRRKEILDRVKLLPLTPKTIHDRSILDKELEIIRHQGFAISHGEWILEASGVAAPIFDQKREVVAVLTISGPSTRFTDELVQQFSQEVMAITHVISAQLGFQPA